ncbi:MAG: fasciclin domain-containing protein [Myxococcota bacterium]
MQDTRIFTATLLASLALGCGDDDVTPAPDAGPRDTGVVGTGDSGVPDRTLVQAATDTGLNSLVSALETAGLTAALQGTDAFTLFGPDEAAFAAAGALPTDPDLLANLLLYHVLPFEADSTVVAQGTALRTSAGLRLPVDRAASPITVDGAGVTTLDVRARNGVLHVIDRVLMPPNAPELVGALTETSTLAAVLGMASASVQNAVAAPGPITVFAPVNAGFDAIDSASLLADPAFLDEVLSFHVSQGQVLLSDLQTGQSLTMANGQTLTVQVRVGGEIVLADASSRTVRIVESDLRVANGVVHLVDRVLLPSRNAVGIVDTLRRGNFNTLATAIDTANLGPVLTSTRSTVFAPTDAAFNALTGGLPTDPALLANVILNHVASGSLSSSALSMRSTVPVGTGLAQLLDFGADPPTVGPARFTNATDLVSTEGVVHGIDQVLLPPAVAETVQLLPELSTLNMAVAAASQSVRDALSGSAAITVFAPVNAAFEGLDLAALTADVARLDELLNYHVVPGQALLSDLTDGQELLTSSGRITVRRSGDTVTLVDGVGSMVQILMSDLRLANGVVHLIDTVLAPGHLIDQARANGLTTLVSAVEAAGLGPTFVQGGPFTVFAPTNDAFTAFGNAVGVDPLTLSAEAMTNVLNHHVLAGATPSSGVTPGASLTNLLGAPLAVTSTAGQLRVGGAPLATPLDVMASNGVVHVVSEVLVPPTITEAAAARPDLATAGVALSRVSPAVAARFAPNVFVRERPATVFLPTNAAFANQMIDPSTMSAAMLDGVLNHHVIPAQLSPAALTSATQRFGSFNGTITVNVDGGGQITVVDASNSPAANVVAQFGTLNGWIYIIDRVLLPQ